MRIWWGEGIGSRISSPEVAVDIRPAYFHAVSSADVGVTCAAPRPGNFLVDTVPLCWVLLCCHVPCHVPFVKNGICWVAGRLPVAGTVPIAGWWLSVPANAVLVPLGLPVIAARGPMGVHSCSCSGVAPCSDLLPSAGVVVAASAPR